MKHIFVLLLVWLCATSALRATNFQFEKGSLEGWKGQGFYVTTADRYGPSLLFGVCSSDVGNPLRKGIRRFRFLVPSGSGSVRFTAYAHRGNNAKADLRLNVRLFSDAGEIVKLVKKRSRWVPVEGLLGSLEGRAQQYKWDVAEHEGRALEIVIEDQDTRPGCYLFCSGFKLYAHPSPNLVRFGRMMKELQAKHQLARMRKFESAFFVSWGNGSFAYTKRQLRTCDLLLRLFERHFRKRGFVVRPPKTKLMVAIFRSQRGLETYLERPLPSSITGLYSRQDNRLLLYDIHQNRALVTGKQRALETTKRIEIDQHRLQAQTTIRRQAREIGQNLNKSTAIHEAAHHVSFNCGLLNRKGDVPLWLAEGLACYCEPSVAGEWQGIGEPNYPRLKVLGTVLKRKLRWIPLQVLITRDDWRTNTPTALLGYAQSWALFHWLIESRPKRFAWYLQRTYTRRTPERRLQDFGQAFGADLEHLEANYHKYIRRIVDRHPIPKTK
ncbi:MAG: DUF1570 domain-containing protein [Gemmataceae bacterium]